MDLDMTPKHNIRNHKSIIFMVFIMISSTLMGFQNESISQLDEENELSHFQSAPIEREIRTLGLSFAEVYTCPVGDDSQCQNALLTGSAHNGYLNYFIEVGANEFPLPAYSESTPVKSMQGFEEVLALLSSGVLKNPGFGCFVSEETGINWVVPCPHGTYSEEGEDSTSLLLITDPPFVYRKLESPEPQPLPLLPEPYPCLHLAGSTPPPGCPVEPPGIGSGGPIQQDGCWLEGSPDAGLILHQPCPVPFYSFASNYADLRSDLLAEAEHFYNNNNLESLSDWERSRAAALHKVDYYGNGIAEMTATQENLAQEVFQLLDTYFDAAQGDNGTLDSLSEIIDALFAGDEYSSMKPASQEVLLIAHATHYASETFWNDFGNFGDRDGPDWEKGRYWNIVGETAALVGGAIIGYGSERPGAMVGSAIVAASVGSYKSEAGGSDPTLPIVDCPLDRSLSENWWPCAIFSQTLRPLNVNDEGYGDENGPDAIMPYFSTDWKGDTVSASVYSDMPNELVCVNEFESPDAPTICGPVIILNAISCGINAIAGIVKVRIDCMDYYPPFASADASPIGIAFTFLPICDGVDDNCDGVDDNCDGIDSDCDPELIAEPDTTLSLPGFTITLMFVSIFIALISRRRLVD